MDDVSGPAPSADRTVDVALLTMIEGELAAVEAALHRLDDGTYGTCHVCDAEIADDVLAVSPAATTCSEHAPAS